MFENGYRQYEKLALKGHCVVSDLPIPFSIGRANIQVEFNMVYNGMIQQQLPLLIRNVEKVVIENQENNSGFLMSLSNSYHVACIFNGESQGKTSYAVFRIDDTNSRGYVYEKHRDVASTVQTLFTITNGKSILKATSYEMQFIKCNCNLTNKMRQLLLRRHKSAQQKARYATQQRNYHSAMAPNKKRAFLENRALKYGTMEPEKKRACLDHLARKYSTMKPEKKRDMSFANALKYSLMKPDKKKTYKKKQVEMRQKTRANTHSLHYYIEQFNRGIREGPYYICVVCNRLLYRKSVLEFRKEKYQQCLYFYNY